jgi:excisionase family DNA binding protein
LQPIPDIQQTKKQPLAVRINDAADMLGLSRPTVYRMAREGHIKIVKIAGRSLVPFADLQRVVEEAA